MAAAKKALEYVEDGMVVGLGTGSTAECFIRLLGRKVRRGLSIVCISTSFDSTKIALENGLALTTLEEIDVIDVAVDGADIVSPDRSLIKGKGGALALEKVVDYLAERFICVVDGSKLRKSFSGILPIEVLPSAYSSILRILKEDLKFEATLRMAHEKRGPVVTDNGNFIIDAKVRNVRKPEALEVLLNTIPGVLENGIFSLRKPTKIIVGGGRTKVL